MSADRRLAIALLAALPWAPALLHPLFGDDAIHVERSLAPRELLGAYVLRAADSGAWWTPPDLAVPYFRPLASLSFLLDRLAWGLAPVGYHATNLALHAVAALLVLRLGRRWLPEAGAWLAAALFAVHPAHGEAVLWASARADLIATVGFLGALDAFLGARRGLGAALLVAALAGKEVAVVLPLLLLLLGDRRSAAVAGAVVAGWLALRSTFAVGTPPPPFVHGPGDPDLPWNAVGGLLLYLGDLVVPVPVDPVVAFPWLSDHVGVLLALGGVGAGTIAWLAARSPDRSLAVLGVAWIGLALLPVLPVSVGERFLLLPSVGFCLLVGAAGAPRWLVPVAALVSFGKALVFGAFVEQARAAVDDALAAVDAAPSAERVLVVDLPAAAALGFPHFLRLERPGRALDVEVLSLAPHFLEPDPAFGSEVVRTEAGLTARATGTPWLGSYIERAFLGEGALPTHVGRDGWAVDVVDGDRDGLRAFTARFDPATTLVLVGHGWRLEPLR